MSDYYQRMYEKVTLIEEENARLIDLLREARERETMLTAERDALRRSICDAEDALSLSRYQSAAVILDRAIPQAARATTPPPTDPPRYPHGSMTAAEGEALALDDLEEAWREEMRRFIHGEEGGSIERVQAARARLPDGVLVPIGRCGRECGSRPS